MRHYRVWLILIIQISLVMACASALTEEQAGKLDRIFKQTGQVQDDRLDEISGIAASGRADNRFWVLNDSGNPPALYLIDAAGQVLGMVHIEGATNVDWEDIGSFTANGKPYLIIADTGDNLAVRPQSRLIVVPEPALPLPEFVPPSAVLTFQFEDGPRDCESVAVEPSAGKIFLLSKRDQPPQLYELPLHLTGSIDVITARRVGVIQSTLIRKPVNPFTSAVDNNTAMDFSPDGRQAVVLTYRNLFVFNRQKGESWLVALNRPYLSFPLPKMTQAESVCFSASGTAVYLTSEKLPAPILTIDLKTIRLSQPR